MEREPGSRQKQLVRHGSVEIFDAAYNLTVPNKMSRHSSQTKLEQIHADHLFIPGKINVLFLLLFRKIGLHHWSSVNILAITKE
jgi:hypothetical protein